MVSVIEVPQKDNEKGMKVSLCSWCGIYWRAILAELVATTTLVLFGCMSSIPVDDGSDIPLFASFGVGFIVLLNIQTFGHISGAHMNPAVTLAAVLWGSIPLALAVIYVIIQCVGATLGYGLLYSLIPSDITRMGVCKSKLQSGLSVYQAIILEALFTSMLILVSLASWDSVNEKKLDSIAVKLGLAIAGLLIVGGPLTGCSMNPAMTLGPTLWIGDWSLLYVYWVGPLLGSAVSTILFKSIWATKADSLQRIKMM